MLITLEMFFFFSIFFFLVQTAATTQCFTVALHQNQCAPPSSIQSFALDDNRFNNPKYKQTLLNNLKCCSFYLFIYVFTAFKCDLMLLSNHDQKRNNDNMRQRQNTFIYGSKEKEKKKNMDQHEKINKCTI